MSEAEGPPFISDLDGGRAGVCISGGGIRAAAFGLGGLQVLSREGMISRAKHLSAVSGGSYILGAFALVAAGLSRNGEATGPTADADASPTEGEALPPKPAAFDRGSPEEQYLRTHLDYLTAGPGGMPAVLGRAIFGFLVNLLFFSLCLWLPMLIAGWIYGWAIPGLRANHGCASSAHCVGGYHASGAMWLITIVLAVAGAVAGIGWVSFPFRRPRPRQMWGSISGACLAAAALFVTATVGVPFLIAFLRSGLAHSSLSPKGAITQQGAATTRSTAPLAIGAATGLVGLVTTMIGFLRASLKSPNAMERAAISRLGNFVTGHRAALLNLLATVSVPLFFLVSVVLVINLGAAHPPLGDTWLLNGLYFIGPLVVLAVLVVLADVNTWSLHPYYKQHLSSAFALERVDVKAADGTSMTIARERDPNEIYKVSDLDERVLICATANIRERGIVPTGFNAVPFVFQRDQVGSEAVGFYNTAEYQGAAERRITVPSAIALAGAAFSPEMGKMTRPALTMLLTLANLRLGVWLPNPKNMPPRGKCPESAWHRKAGFLARKLYFRTPRPFYVFSELLRRNRSMSHYVYVTDGGHYENLGLVELLRRKCTEIWCIDASGDRVDSFNTIGDALAIARAENLIVEHTLDPRRDMAPDPDVTAGELQFVRSTHAMGVITYPDETNAKIVVVKAGVPADAPWEVRAYHERHTNFPCDTTLDQLYDSTRFDAYRALGEFAMKKAWCAATGPS